MNRIRMVAVWLAVTAVAVAALNQPRVHAQEQEAARKITKKVAPLYPEVAKLARLTGTVKLMATVGPEGDVKGVKTIGGNAVFVPAAEEAVKKWKFEASKKESGEIVAITFEAPQRQ